MQRDEGQLRIGAGWARARPGKIGIPEHILDKPGALTDEEWIERRKQPEIGLPDHAGVPRASTVAEGSGATTSAGTAGASRRA